MGENNDNIKRLRALSSSVESQEAPQTPALQSAARLRELLEQNTGEDDSPELRRSPTDHRPAGGHSYAGTDPRIRPAPGESDPTSASAGNGFPNEPSVSGEVTPKLNSRFLRNSQVCKKCRIEMFGPFCASCGGSGDKERDFSSVIIGGCVLTIAAVFIAGIYVLTHVNLHQWFPDEQMARQKMKHAHSLYERGLKDEAVAEAQKSVDCAPNLGDLHFEFSALLEKEGRPSDALDHAKLAASLLPNDDVVQEGYAEMLDRQHNNSAEAIMQYEKVIKAFPKKDTPYFWAASACERSEQFKKAAGYYREFIARDKDNIDGSWVGLARCYEQMGDLKQAIASLQEAKTKVSYSAPVRYQLALLLEKAGNKAEAFKELERSIELDPTTADHASGDIARLSSKPGIMSVPVEKRGNSFIVTAMLNDRVRAKLIVDSGAELVCLKPSVAEHLGIELSEAQPISISGATGEGEAYCTRLKSIKIGDLTEPYVSVAFSDMPDAIGDGLLGMTYLERFNFTLDPKLNILKLERRKQPAAED